jgi:hypothetical protein
MHSSSRAKSSTPERPARSGSQRPIPPSSDFWRRPPGSSSNPTSGGRCGSYRVTVKPVAGEVEGSESGLKLLVGYDLLVLVRPPVIRNSVRADRKGSELTLINQGNASVELAEGKQCEAGGKICRPLPAKRLYAGTSWTQKLSGSAGGEYRVRSADGWSTLKF